VMTVPLAIVPGAAVAALVPRLSSVVLLRGGMAALGNSLYRGGYELLYDPVPIATKRATKTGIDVACERIGTAARSACALSAIALVSRPEPTILAITGVLALSALALARRLQRGYVHSLEAALVVGHPGQAGAVHLELSQTQTQTRLSREDLLKQ